jgi:hypothetical protein
MTSAAQFVCNYAVLRFLPYLDAGEFVNVGIVAHCADLGWCAYAGDDADPGRVMQFFTAIDPDDYLAKRSAMFAEIARVCTLIQNTSDRRTSATIFQELVKPRESLFRFSSVRSVLTSDPVRLLHDLADQLIQSKATGPTLHLHA